MINYYVWRWTNEGRLNNTIRLALVLFEMDKTKYLGRRSSFLDAHPVVHVVQPRKKPEAEIIHELWRLSGDVAAVPQSLVSSLSHPTFVDHPRRHNLEGVSIRMRSVVISELSARIYKSFSFSGSGSWIWLLLCVLSMCAYNSSRVESADSEMIPPSSFPKPFKSSQFSKGPSSTSKQLQRSQFQQLCFSLWAEKHQAMTRVATPSYYVFPEDDYEYQ